MHYTCSAIPAYELSGLREGYEHCSNLPLTVYEPLHLILIWTIHIQNGTHTKMELTPK